MKERDCANCKHHTEDGCSSWDCEFEKAMTREEAITYLNVIWNRYKAEYEIERETLDAYHMAIEALKILGDDGIVNCCGCIHWKTDGGAMMMCELWDTPMGDFDYCSYGKREGGDSE